MKESMENFLLKTASITFVGGLPRDGSNYFPGIKIFQAPGAHCILHSLTLERIFCNKLQGLGLKYLVW